MRYLIFNKDRNKVVYVGKLGKYVRSLENLPQLQKLLFAYGDFEWAIHTEASKDFQKLMSTIDQFNIRVKTHKTVWATKKDTGIRTYFGSVPMSYNQSKPNSVYLAHHKAAEFMADCQQRYSENFTNFGWFRDLDEAPQV